MDVKETMWRCLVASKCTDRVLSYLLYIYFNDYPIWNCTLFWRCVCVSMKCRSHNCSSIVINILDTRVNINKPENFNTNFVVFSLWSLHYSKSNFMAKTWKFYNTHNGFLSYNYTGINLITPLITLLSYVFVSGLLIIMVFW